MRPAEYLLNAYHIGYKNDQPTNRPITDRHTDRRVGRLPISKAEYMKLIVTGGAGFIGSAVVRYLINETTYSVVNVDKLTYAGNLTSLGNVADSERYTLEVADICDSESMHRILATHKPDGILHLAAESHVDRSIDAPHACIETNVVGTARLLEACRSYWTGLGREAQRRFRFHHVSTDEVYGDLEQPDALFTERTAYAPSSPYSATKASSDHLVRAWHRTFGLPVVITNCSNNYGPYHFPEKFIPHVILNALRGRTIPVYGDGQQVRDWLYVEDHARALIRVFESGADGETYNIGGFNEQKNLDVVHAICHHLDVSVNNRPRNVASYSDLITFVQDRPGHDRRYAIDATKLERELGWRPAHTFGQGLKQTVQWYLGNPEWWQPLLEGGYALGRQGVSAA